MVSSNARTVKDYLASLPPDRRSVVEAVRDVVNRSLPAGYEECMQYGMIGWTVPLSRYADTYNGQPLGIAALASQKNYLTIYLMSVYADPALTAEFEAAWARAGKKLDMGKSCVRFKRLEDLALDVLADVLGRVDADAYVARYQAARGAARQGTATKAAAKTATAKKAAAKKSTKAAAKTATTAKKAAAKKSTKAAATKSKKAAATKSTRR